MKTSLLFASFALSLAFCTADANAQSAVVTGGNMDLCNPGNNGKMLTWSGNWQDVDESTYDIVGAYAPVYGAWSPMIYYSPGRGIGADPPTENPGSTSGTETVNLPKEADEATLLGAYVWFEYGVWSKSGGSYTWQSAGELCLWYWIPNNGATCFAAGTHVLTPGGSKSIENLVVGDQVLSSPRDNPTSTLAAQRVTRVTSGREKLFAIVAGGQTIHATQNHPVSTKDHGWIPAGSLTAGDRLRSHTGRWVEVESAADGVATAVYNIVLDGKSAFFVGRSDWGFSICVSDACSADDPYSPRSELHQDIFAAKIRLERTDRPLFSTDLRVLQRSRDVRDLTMLNLHPDESGADTSVRLKR